MNFTAKSRYALKIMLDLADFDGNGLQKRQKIAARQGISPDYMDHIMARLRANHLITSIRGRQGGFKLERPAAQISLWDIFYAVEDGLFPVQCVEDTGCQLEAHCIAHDAWLDVASIIKHELAERSLADLLKKWQIKKDGGVPLINLSTFIGHECKGPKKAGLLL